jgi:hypothetical protein
MAFIFFNPNPAGKFVGDCVVRAISKATGQSWEKTYIGIVEKGLNMRDMPSANRVWAAYLKDLGFNKYIIPNTCPECYSIRDFAYENPRESYDNMEESYARGRSPMTGRYVSRDSYDRGYSSEEEKEQLKRSLEDMKRKIDHM